VDDRGAISAGWVPTLNRRLETFGEELIRSLKGRRPTPGWCAADPEAARWKACFYGSWRTPTSAYTVQVGLLRMPILRASSWLLVVAGAFALAAGCSSNENVRSDSDDVVGDTHWVIPSDVLKVGGTVRVPYEAAPRWTSTAACGGGLLEGTHFLGVHLRDRFDQIDSIGGYSCRRNTADSSRMSVHGTGRALDVFIPMKGSHANSELGDPVANWLILHAQKIGVQLIIWNHRMWRANGTNDVAYGGPIPHIDHIHVEITREAAAESTPWFADPDEDDTPDATPDAHDASTPDTSKPDASRPDTSKPDTSAPDTSKPDTDRPDSAPPPVDAATDPGTDTPDATPPPPPGEDASPGADDEPPSQDPPAIGDPEDEPGERDSLGSSDDRTNHPTSIGPDNGGCSVHASGGASGTSGAAWLVAMGLALRGIRRRRR
jgi:MYXO-CTERM domain-containing protein